ncbi:thiamine phosphate synthase [Prevotella sp.]|uniref:thiamine phosphate synthase n=1 Tax=uncultured Prevotella sp. TaxID=159272 RepID=UPI0025FB4DE8|nr:thiamine phosphate synthase [Prevotella sp.]MCI7120050.1 thiamine phosphate synthase [Prevotella sp.]
MKLAIMTKSTFFVEEDKILATLFEAGLDNLHLYKPGSSPIYSERLLSLLPDTTYNKITVHNNFYLKDEYRLAGIHLDTPSEQPPLGYKGHISRTCNDINSLKDTKKQSSYVFLGNVFGEQGDPELPSLDMNELENASDKGLIDKKVFALGGMNADNIRLARELGFGGVVIGDDLWNRFDIHNQSDFKELITHFERLKKLVY